MTNPNPDPKSDPDDIGPLAKPMLVIKIGFWMLFLGFALGYLVFRVWPPVPLVNDASWVELLGKDMAFRVTADGRLILLVMLMGALGSYVATTSSYLNWLGRGELGERWTWWYVLRPLIGAALALIFYAAIRGGFFTSASGAETLNAYGTAATAALVGMFSNHAVEKLKQIFDAAFGRPQPPAGSTGLTPTAVVAAGPASGAPAVAAGAAPAVAAGAAPGAPAGAAPGVGAGTAPAVAPGATTAASPAATDTGLVSASGTPLPADATGSTPPESEAPKAP